MAIDEFREWFGNSKIVDANGEPLVVYHGTKGDFSEFKTPAWFTPNKQFADLFSADWSLNGEREASSKVISSYIRMENPVYTNNWLVTEPNADMCEQFRMWEKEGHDGIVFTSDDGEIEYIVFQSNQIRSATDISKDFHMNDIEPNTVKAAALSEKNISTHPVEDNTMSQTTPDRAYAICEEAFISLRNSSDAKNVFLNAAYFNDNQNDAYLDIQYALELTDANASIEGQLTSVSVTLGPDSEMYVFADLSPDDLKDWSKDVSEILQQLLTEAANAMRVMCQKCRDEGLQISLSDEPIQLSDELSSGCEKVVDAEWLTALNEELSSFAKNLGSDSDPLVSSADSKPELGHP